MSEKKPQLGRGLSALLGNKPIVPAAAEPTPGNPARAMATPGEASAGSPPRQLSLGLLHPNPYQPRQDFDEDALEALTLSIKTQGVLQPILVRPHPQRPAEFQIVAGERRWRAAQRIPLHKVPVLVRELNDQAMMEAALVENVQRQDLNPIEEAEAYRRLKDEFGYTQEDLADTLGKSRPYIANALRLLTLPSKTQVLVRHGKISAGHARAILGARDPDALAQAIIDQDLTVRLAEDIAKGRRDLSGKATKPSRIKLKPKPAIAGPRPKDADTRKLERELSLELGLAVSIDFDGKGGKVTLAYQNLEQLNGLIAKLR